MPSSHFHLIPTILATLGRYPEKRFLDIGCGSGKYGMLIKEYLSPTLLDAVEVHKEYLNDCHFWIYDCVHVQDIMTFDFGQKPYDMYLLLNIIDHLTKDDAVSLIKKIPGDILIAVPQTWYQHDHEDIWERHKSFWKKEDFNELFENDWRIEHIQNPYEGQLTDNMILIQKSAIALKWNDEEKRWI